MYELISREKLLASLALIELAIRVSRLSQHFTVSLAIRRNDSKVGLGMAGSFGSDCTGAGSSRFCKSGSSLRCRIGLLLTTD